MSAQPTVAVHDYLSEVRIFPSTSAEFANAVLSHGVSASLATLGEGASLLAAIRNDSGGAAEMRILYSVTKGGRTRTDMEVGRSLAAGEVTLVAPKEIGGALAGLLNAGRPGLMTGSPTVQPLDRYQGATVTISVDSVTLANGQFIGADTQNFFNRLVAEDATKKRFFSDLTGSVSAGQTQAQIEQTLTTRKAAVDAAKTATNFAAFTESRLCSLALMRLQHFGMASLTDWATKENAALAGRPLIHRHGPHAPERTEIQNEESLPGWPNERPILLAFDCPNGHHIESNFAVSNTHAGLRDLLDAGTFRLDCFLCHTEFPPAEEQIRSLRSQLAGGPRPPGLHFTG